MEHNTHEKFGNPLIKKIIDKLKEEIIALKSTIKCYKVIEIKYQLVKYYLGLQSHYASWNEDRKPSEDKYKENQKNIDELEDLLLKLYIEFNNELKIIKNKKKKTEQIKKLEILDCSYFDEMLDLMNNMK